MKDDVIRMDDVIRIVKCIHFSSINIFFMELENTLLSQVIEYPEVTRRKWVPPYLRRRRRRRKLPRIPPEAITQPLYEFAKLRKVKETL